MRRCRQISCKTDRRNKTGCRQTERGKTLQIVQTPSSEEKTLRDKMSNSMVEILSKVDAGRSVGIELINRTKSITLTFKSSHCESGYVLSPPPSTVSPGSKENCIYVKTAGTACGSVGLIVYHFQRNSLVIMFSNPFDRNFYSTICGVWITDESVIADHGLFNDLYYDKMPSLSFQRLVVGRDTQALEVRKDNVVVSATMSDDYKAILKVEIADNN